MPENTGEESPEKKKHEITWGWLGKTGRITHKLLWVIFGGILPIFVLSLDPGIFKTGIPFTGGQYNQAWYPILGRIRVFFYGLVGLGILMLIVFLIFSILPPIFNAALSGLFIFGAMVAFPFGPLMLLFSAPPALGLLFVIVYESLVNGNTEIISGILQGSLNNEEWTFLYLFLAPFFAGLLTLPIIIVYAQTALAAAVRAAKKIKKAHILLIMVISCLIFIAIAAGLQIGANAYSNYWMKRLTENKENIDLRAVKAMRMAFWCTKACYDDLRTAYKESESVVEKERIAEIYDLIKEKDIKEDIW